MYDVITAVSLGIFVIVTVMILAFLMQYSVWLRFVSVKIITLCYTVYSRFPDSYFPGWFFSRKDVSRKVVSRMVIFPDKTISCDWSTGAHLTWITRAFNPAGLRQMLIFHHSSKTNGLRNVQGSIKTASVSTFLTWPSLINYRYSVWSLCGSSLLLVTMQTTNSSPHQN